MNIDQWNWQCITLLDRGKPFGYIALVGDQYQLGIGGLRIIEAPCSRSGIQLVFSLAQTMYYKARAAGLGCQGGKAVIYTSSLKNKKYYLKRFAEILNQLQGRYITAVDMGSSKDDMRFLSYYTDYITCHHAAKYEVSYYTAKTVLMGIDTACDYADITPQRFVVQGAGKLGRHLVKLLFEKYKIKHVIVADTCADTLNDLACQYAIRQTDAADIYRHSADVFISAADSHIIGVNQAQQMNCQVFASAANCPFVSDVSQAVLEQKGIIVLPDYLINSGGLIYCAYQYGIVENINSQIKQVGRSIWDYFCNNRVQTCVS